MEAEDEQEEEGQEEKLGEDVEHVRMWERAQGRQPYQAVKELWNEDIDPAAAK